MDIFVDEPSKGLNSGTEKKNRSIIRNFPEVSSDTKLAQSACTREHRNQTSNTIPASIIEGFCFQLFLPTHLRA